MLYRFILAADIGGSHISTAICDLVNCSVIETTLSRRSIDSKGSADDILRSWSDALEETAQKINVPIEGVAVAMPGPFDYEKGISYISGFDKYETLYGISIRDHFASKTGLPAEAVRFRNDAEACIAGEARVFTQEENVIGITLGTGFGSALHRRGTTADLNLGAAPYGESVADDFLSNRWLIARFRQLTGLSVPDVRSMILSDAGPSIIDQIFEEFAANMVAILRPALEAHDIRILIIAGGIANAARLFLPHLTGHFPELDIRLAQLGDQAALLGAAIEFENVNGQKEIVI